MRKYRRIFMELKHEYLQWFLICCTNNAILYFKTYTLILRTKQWQIWTGWNVVFIHTAWSRFVSGAFSRAEISVCLLESGHVSASTLTCVPSISRHWSDISTLVSCWNSPWHDFSLCQLLQTIPGSMGQELGCSCLRGQGSLIYWYSWSLSTLSIPVSSWIGGKFEDWLMRRHIGSLWETAGVSRVAMFQMKCLATKLFPPWAGQAPKLSSAFILAEIHHVLRFLPNCHCFAFAWSVIAESDDFHSSCHPFGGVCLLL